MGADQKRYAVFAVRKGKDGQTIWVRAGSAVTNRDASINITLDVLPIDGQLHLRDKATVKEDQPPQQQHVHKGCGGTLEFVAELAAPGIGSSYRCTKCHGSVLRVRGGAFRDAADVDPSEIELSPREVE
jgi:hypothetical protein